MGISEKEKNLFKKWKTDRDKFVADGVVNEKEYL